SSSGMQAFTADSTANALATEDALRNTCGLGPCFRPAWLRKFGTPRYFLIVYSLLGTVQAMAFVYFVATLTTLEKRFKIPSRTTGIVISGNEISQILLSLTLSYYGGKGNRPLWIAWGVALSGLSCFILMMPHIVYGPGQNALALTKEYLDTHIYNMTNNTAVNALATCRSERMDPKCEDNELGEYSMMPLILIFLSQFVLGIGSTMYFALGQPYLDDNVKKTQTPMLLDPSLTPIITKRDPRWLGWIILGTSMLAFSFMIAMFPKQLQKKDSNRNSGASAMLSDFMPNDPIPSTKQEKNSERNFRKSRSTAKHRYFPTALKRLLKNKLLMTNITASIFYILAASAYMTYMIKYLETQFQQSASGANLIAGVASILSSVAGFLISGYLISKYKPRTSYVLGWNVIVGCVYITAEIIFIFLGCKHHDLQGVHSSTGQLQLINECNSGCHCDNLKYMPVCSKTTGITYYSACHAGCRSVYNNSKGFSDCSCLSVPHDLLDSGDGASNDINFENSVKAGPCLLDCGYNFILFLIVVCVMHCLGNSGKIGNILVNYSFHKSFAQGLALLCLSLLAFIPGPILFGAIIDSTCLVWDQTCGKKGNCWLYHTDNFRLYVNLTTAGLTTIGMLLDAVVWRLGRNLDLYGEDDDKKPKIESEKQTFQQMK
ncbi:hypothetical protein L9F63_025920, partial [Diploptera punctata]